MPPPRLPLSPPTPQSAPADLATSLRRASALPSSGRTAAFITLPACPFPPAAAALPAAQAWRTPAPSIARPPSFSRYLPHSLRAPRVLWGEPLWGSSPPSGLAALTPPQAANAEGWASSVPPASSLSPMGCPSPSPGFPTGPLLLGPAPRLSGHVCRVVHVGRLSQAPFLLPSSGAAVPLGGLAARS